MPDFKREERYIVVKRKDVTAAQEERLRKVLSANEIPTRECVVVESDWPIYEGVWALVERLATGQPLPYMVDRETLVRTFRAWLEDREANPDDFHTVEEAEAQPTAQRSEYLADALIGYLTSGDTA